MTPPPNIQDPSGYDALPEAVRHRLTREEWMFLSDDLKMSLVEDMTEPDLDSEDPPE